MKQKEENKRPVVSIAQTLSNRLYLERGTNGEYSGPAISAIMNEYEHNGLSPTGMKMVGDVRGKSIHFIIFQDESSWLMSMDVPDKSLSFQAFDDGVIMVAMLPLAMAEFGIPENPVISKLAKQASEVMLADLIKKMVK